MTTGESCLDAPREEVTLCLISFLYGIVTSVIVTVPDDMLSKSKLHVFVLCEFNKSFLALRANVQGVWLRYDP